MSSTAEMRRTAATGMARAGVPRFTVARVLSAIVAHFVEIHFGFDIASTATYFWSLIALFSLVGMGTVFTCLPWLL